MKRYPLLELCARIEGHAAQHQMLREYCHTFEDWLGMLECAEREGMAPLLRKHLLESGADIPASVRRSLNILYRRHQKQARVRLHVLEDLLALFQHHQTTPILLKGSALCLSLYPDPALRPMRDMDILFSKEQVDEAQAMLREAGFEQAQGPIPQDHHHLPSLHKTVDGVRVCFELHRGLYPNCPPWYPKVDFENLRNRGRKIKVGEQEVFTLNHEETLHYLYQHGFRSPLTYETFKLVNAADIIGYIERYFHEIDWTQIRLQFPDMLRGLALLQHISPFNFDKIPQNHFIRQNVKRRLRPTPFKGWPHKRVKEFKAKVSLGTVLKETFLPPSWWLRIYYGAGYSLWRYLKVLCWSHPKNVIWWVNVYSHFVTRTETASNPDTRSPARLLRIIFTSTINKIRGVVQKLSDF